MSSLTFYKYISSKYVFIRVTGNNHSVKLLLQYLKVVATLLSNLC